MSHMYFAGQGSNVPLARVWQPKRVYFWIIVERKREMTSAELRQMCAYSLDVALIL